MGVPLVVEHVSRSFSSQGERIRALEDVSLAIGPGQIVGLLGRNGAGKTTLVKVICGLLEPSAGDIRIDGITTRTKRGRREAMRHASVVFGGDRGLYGRLSACDNARFFGMINGIEPRILNSRVEQLLHSFGLSGAAHQRVETFSKGMKQRLHLAIGMLADPKILILDEPTVGLDTIEAQRLRDVIAELRRVSDTTVLLTSHNLTDIEQLADSVAVLQHGRLTHYMSLKEFVKKERLVATITVEGSGKPPPLPSAEPKDGSLEFEMVATDLAWTVRISLPQWNRDALAALAAWWPEDCDHMIQDVAVEPVRLEHVFAQLSNSGPLD